MRKMTCGLAALAMSAAALAQTVTVSLTSPQNGTTVSPGATITWTIGFTVSSGDNAGLALLATDLAQDATNNPATIDIPYAAGVPGAMTNFSRPAGISNPGEGGNTTGYVGVQRGTAGARNLVQIGGGQNTFGQAPPPSSGVAQNVTASGGVGQSGSVTLATGSFTAPSATGLYTFQLQNTIANVIQTLNSPPNFSPVIAATVAGGTSSISFTVGGASFADGDMNCDGFITVGDIGGFVLALTNPTQYAIQFPTCDINLADVNNDGFVTVGDIGGFVALLTGN